MPFWKAAGESFVRILTHGNADCKKLSRRKVDIIRHWAYFFLYFGPIPGDVPEKEKTVISVFTKKWRNLVDIFPKTVN